MREPIGVAAEFCETWIDGLDNRAYVVAATNALAAAIEARDAEWSDEAVNLALEKTEPLRRDIAALTAERDTLAKLLRQWMDYADFDDPGEAHEGTLYWRTQRALATNPEQSR